MAASRHLQQQAALGLQSESIGGTRSQRCLVRDLDCCKPFQIGDG
jgi:hypothetical protein